jgi:hypothetical protein
VYKGNNDEIRYSNNKWKYDAQLRGNKMTDQRSGQRPHSCTETEECSEEKPRVSASTAERLKLRTLPRR